MLEILANRQYCIVCAPAVSSIVFPCKSFTPILCNSCLETTLRVCKWLNFGMSAKFALNERGSKGMVRIIESCTQLKTVQVACLNKSRILQGNYLYYLAKFHSDMQDTFCNERIRATQRREKILSLDFCMGFCLRYYKLFQEYKAKGRLQSTLNLNCKELRQDKSTGASYQDIHSSQSISKITARK